MVGVHPATATETFRILGGQLGATQPETVFTASRDHIVVYGLRTGWSAGAGQCHTAVQAQYPGLAFTFDDGNTSTKALLAAGYRFSTGQNGLPGTSLTLCRDATGKIASVAAQVALMTSSGNDLTLYIVNATNTSRAVGSSYSELSVTNFQEAQSFTASAGTVNRLSIAY
jgi:hypothetical protein